MLTRNPVLNLKLRESSLVVTFDKNSTAAHLFSSRVGERRLQFVAIEAGKMRDLETQSIWNRNTGVALEGPLKGTRLKQQVGIVSYARMWKVFHPNSQSVRPTK